MAFGAPAPAALEPCEHDDFGWYTYAQSDELVDWPIEQDALPARREALRTLAQVIRLRDLT